MDENEVIDTGEQIENTTPEQEALETLKGHDVDIKDSGQKVDTEKETEKEDKPSDEKKTEDKDKKDEEDIGAVLKEQNKAVEDVTKDLADKGVNYDDLANEYMENGKLSDESMATLDKAGYPKSVVDAFIRGWEATVTRFTDAVYEKAGGKAEYERMCKFIASLGDAEVATFNSAIEDADLNKLGVMFEGYKARMTTKYGTSNPSVLGGAAKGTQGGFASKTAMVKAINDPRYGTDPNYTEKVQKMTMNATFID